MQVAMPQNMFFPQVKAAVRAGLRYHLLALRQDGGWVLNFWAEGQSIYSVATNREPLVPRVFATLDAMARLLETQSATLDEKFTFTVASGAVTDMRSAIQEIETQKATVIDRRQGALPL